MKSEYVKSHILNNGECEDDKMNGAKRVYCLYRVSTKGQVDKDDIPMQKTACHEFAERQRDWVIVKEFYEKGVSGFKVSADDRDAIQDIKAAAERDEFDILLVFMFDRLGRRQNETPFVVEWFNQQGIEVWSTQEGQQRFESEADYLINFMRYWQANGESRKTSTRVKTRLSQLTSEGVYTGGPTPYGYKLIPSGNFNKRGKELMEIIIDEDEAKIVQLIFEKTLKEGIGSHQMASLLNNKNLRTHNGSKFQSNTINRILKNRMYCGYFISGETVSPHLPRIQIVDENMYNQVQRILQQRSLKYDGRQQIAKTTRGSTLLSGNVYCAHCGGKMISTSHVDKHIRKDGSVYESRRSRYMCCNRVRKGVCHDAQSVYSAERVDKVVESIILEYLSKIKQTPKDIAIEQRYQAELQSLRRKVRELKADNENYKKQLIELSSEIANALMGESKFTPDMLSNAIDSTKEKIAENADLIAQYELQIGDRQGALDNLDYYYDTFISWADEYQSASKEQKKMIACNLIKEVRIGNGYSIDIIFDMNYHQFIQGAQTQYSVEKLAG